MEERKIKGYQLVDQEVTRDQIKEGNYYFNARIGELPVKVIRKADNEVRCEVFNHFQSKFKMFYADYEGFYTKTQVPVYED